MEKHKKQYQDKGQLKQAENKKNKKYSNLSSIYQLNLLKRMLDQP